jgi:hypothetical protein
MFDHDGKGVVTWEELDQIFVILHFPPISMESLLIWAGATSQSPPGLEYHEWKRLLRNYRFKKFPLILLLLSFSLASMFHFHFPVSWQCYWTLRANYSVRSHFGS